MSLVPLLHDDVAYDALHALHGNFRCVVSLPDCFQRHDDPQHQKVFRPLVWKRGTSLIDIQSEAKIAAADFLYPRQSRHEYIGYDYGLRKRNPVAVNHDFGLPEGCPFEVSKSYPPPISSHNLAISVEGQLTGPERLKNVNRDVGLDCSNTTTITRIEGERTHLDRGLPRAPSMKAAATNSRAA